MISFTVLTIGATILGGVFVWFDGPQIVKNTVIPKYRGFRKLNSILGKRYTGFFTVIWISICMILKALYISFIQYMNSTIKRIDKKTYEVSYVINGKTFKMIVKPKRGPCDVLLVSDNNQEDVGDIILPYLGPEDNFHGHEYTPSFFQRDTLTFEMFDGREITFEKDEKIDLNKVGDTSVKNGVLGLIED